MQVSGRLKLILLAILVPFKSANPVIQWNSDTFRAAGDMVVSLSVRLPEWIVQDVSCYTFNGGNLNEKKYFDFTEIEDSWL